MEATSQSCQFLLPIHVLNDVALKMADAFPELFQEYLVKIGV